MSKVDYRNKVLPNKNKTSKLINLKYTVYYHYK